MLPRLRATVAVFLVGAMLFAAVTPVHADAGSFLYSRKFYGLLSVASSAFCFKVAYDARKEANRNYRYYKEAGTPTTAATYYNESKRADTRMAVMLGLGAGTLLYGAYLLFERGSDDAGGGPARKPIQFKGVGMDVQGDVQNRAVQLQLSRPF
jgi:hypothetical protein